tara:strand:- start:937 stop:1116 length:180 start_codon:yes stop_codon:yes gene_type:complete
MVKKMAKNQRMAKLIEHLANLEQLDHQRMSKDGRSELGKIWKLLGMPDKESLNMETEEK